jgi:GWxTD domain-containing protein
LSIVGNSQQLINFLSIVRTSLVRVVRTSLAFRVAAVLGLLFVHWQIDPAHVHAQRNPGSAERDTANSDSVARMLFGPRDKGPVHHEKVLRAIVAAGGGLYWQFTDLLRYEAIFQPTVGFDFYAAPDGGLGFLLGAKGAFNPRFATLIALGGRLPLKSGSYSNAFFLDAQILFYDEGLMPQAFQTGGRIALAHEWIGKSISEELRFAVEYRGSRGADSLSPIKPLLWAGLEAAFSFSLIGTPKELTRKDSIRAGLKYIATAQELSDFDAITSINDLDSWLRSFWSKREQLVNGTGGDVEYEFYSREQVANARFSKSQRLGVDTDPGRILVLYGLPDHSIEGRSVVDENASYMLWTFHKRISGSSNAIVIFRKIGGGDWRQEYSNIQGEQTGLLPNDMPLAIEQSLPPFIRQ